MIGIARAPGTCGELVQGKIAGSNFLVTCPVDMYSVVTVKLNKSGMVSADPDLSKVRLAVEKTVRFLERSEMGAEVLVASGIPRGKGMASSTADISAACAAAAAALGQPITAGDIAMLALSIEPTDGLMFPGITLFDHIAGETCRHLGGAPDINVVVVDLGGTVDTVSFNTNVDLDRLNRKKEAAVSGALSILEKALAAGDVGLVGQAATESALANQEILDKKELAQLIRFCRQAGGIGVNVAHSGTVVGLLWADQPRPGIIEKLAGAGFDPIINTRVIGGGIDVLEERAGDQVWLPLSTYMEATCGRLRKSTG